MFRLRLLPWEYGMRNLLRRPTRSLLTLSALATVVLLVFVVVGFIRGMEESLAVSGDPQVMLVHAMASGGNLENSVIAASVPGVLSGSLQSLQRRYGVDHVSPELYAGTRVSVGQRNKAGLGLVRGVTQRAALVRRQVRIVGGTWPGPGEVLVGRLAYAKIGCPAEGLAIGQSVKFEGNTWRVSGQFVANGSTLESEIWCPLSDLQQTMKRQDLTLVSLLLAAGNTGSEVRLLCKERLDLALAAVGEQEYYAALQRYYRPVRVLGWLVVVLVAGAGVFAGINAMYGAVLGRMRELAALQAMGFRRRAIMLSLVQEACLLAAAASLLAGGVALVLVDGMAVRFTMSAFTLRVDSTAVLVGCGAGLFIGALGAIPPAIRMMRLPVAESLKAL